MDSSTETFIASPILGKPYADRGAGDAGLIFHTLRGEGFDASEDGTGRGTPLVPAASPIAFDPTQITSAQNRSNPQPGDPCHTLAKGAHAPAIAFNLRGREGGAMPEVSNVASLRAAPGGSSRSYVTAFHGTQDPDISGDVTHPMGRNQGQEQAALIGSAVRRLTPRECEFLQGFPADYTLIPTKARKKMEDDMLAYIQRTYPNMDRMEAERLAKDGPRYKALGNSWAVPNARWIGERIDMVDQLIDSKP